MNKKIELIKKLREITLAGFSSCKITLEESKNDLEKAIKILQKKGMNKVLKRSITNRSINEGRVVIEVKDDMAVLVEMRCETDFVSKNENYLKFIKEVIKLVFDEFDELGVSFNPKENQKIKDYILKESSKFGEKIEFSNFHFVQKQKGQEFSFYQHTNGKYGALLLIEGSLDKETLEGMAMQVVVMQPEVISISEISNKEKNDKRFEIQKEVNEKLFNKSLEMRNKIIENKLDKKLKEKTLLNQKYIKDESKTIEQILFKNNVKIISMKWFVIGE